MLYPRAWRDRYGAEFEAHLIAGPWSLRSVWNVAISALRERAFPTQIRGGAESALGSFCRSAPWAVFGLGPVVLLAFSYLTACLILWSGWHLFLPQSPTPFVRVDGVSVYYFGVGRLLYFTAPVVIGWCVAFLAGRYRMSFIWPLFGLVALALIGGAAHVQANPVGLHVRMTFSLGPRVENVPSGLVHALWLLLWMTIPYLIWRFGVFVSKAKLA